ncbi:MAG TPA: discoidin domain-containing protein [Polyangiaceae bacterium]|nr:discoidin domain-containing protein [Polyangiaceae bacterium]
MAIARDRGLRRLLRRALATAVLSGAAPSLLACSLSAPTLDAYARGSAGSGGYGGASGAATNDGGTAAQPETGGSSAAGSSSSCAPCDTASPCSSAAECKSGVCTLGSCQAPTCLDGVTNGNETSTDCGGSCPTCGLGLACSVAGDCTSGACDQVCVAPTCMDSTKNQAETDVDCGGPCAPCTAGEACLKAADCDSNVCTAKRCVAASCKDQLQNQGESDVDCGGTHCPACALSAACAAMTDCASGVCQSKMCVPAAATGTALHRNGWSTTSSTTYVWPTAEAIDGDPTTRWTYGAPQAPGMTFTLDLGAPQYFFSVVLDSSMFPGDAAAGFDLYFSLDGTYGKSARSVVGAPTATVTFSSAVVARYIRFELNQSASTWWSIGEISVNQ